VYTKPGLTRLEFIRDFSRYLYPKLGMRVTSLFFYSNIPSFEVGVGVWVWRFSELNILKFLFDFPEYAPEIVSGYRYIRL